MRKKRQKTREENAVETYFPMRENDIKLTVEKPYKKPEIETSEIIISQKNIIDKEEKKPGKKRATKNSNKKSTKKRSNNGKISWKKKIDISYTPSKVKLQEKGYELIITEKPQAAQKIASALGDSKKRDVHGIPYYDIDRNGKEIVIACAVGHLFTLKQNSSGYPVFDISWVPNYLVKSNDFTKKYYDAILKLVKEAGSITVATDYDIEGEVIGLNVVRFICNQKDANRMKFSTLTEKELDEAYENKSPTLNWGQAIAGEARHYLDWFYGINFSRALMDAIKTTGRFRIMSIGRVQGPALNLIVERERKIQTFVSKPYWQVFISLENYPDFELKYNRDIFDKKELEKFRNLAGRIAEAITKKKQEILPPNFPFSLTDLQMEAYRLFGITPAKTLQISQSLYLAGLISYPRTSSQKLPDSIGYRDILNQVARRYHAEHLISRDKPVEGKKSDPAHPSIYPTRQQDEALIAEERKIYDLIARRFLSLFCEDAVIDNKTISVEINDNIDDMDKKRADKNESKLIFTIRGAEIKKKGWLEIYPIKIHETELPDVNGRVKIISVRDEEKETQPPKRFSPASIVSELEKRNLGTKATRANIIETLYDRGYIKEKSIEATPLGISLISTMEKYSPIIIDEKLTRKFEKEMDSITEAKKDFQEKEKKIIDEAKATIAEISKDFEKKKEDIGKELLKADVELREQEREANKLNQCPVCQKGNLAIKYSKVYRKSFVACDRYPDCKTTYSLPTGFIKPVTPRKNCEECGFPMLMRLSKGKRPWTFCFNKNCAKNKERLEEYKKKLEEENSGEE